jgi:hypothetical protein
MARQLEWAKDRPGVAGRWQAHAAAFSGRWREASRFWESASGSRSRAGSEALVRQLAIRSVQAALLGQVGEARAR